jgi:hypothetical protein
LYFLPLGNIQKHHTSSQRMKKIVRYILILTFIFPITAKAQFENFKDSVVQLFGVVMTADSLKGVPGVSVCIKG